MPTSFSRICLSAVIAATLSGCFDDSGSAQDAPVKEQVNACQAPGCDDSFSEEDYEMTPPLENDRKPEPSFVHKKQGTESRSGRFVSPMIEGLDYHTATHQGITDEAGQFHYAPGEVVTFTVGNIVLGQTLGERIVEPVDLVSYNASGDHLRNLYRFLMAIDVNDNVRYHTLPRAVRNLGVKYQMDVEEPESQFMERKLLKTMSRYGTAYDLLDDQGSAFTNAYQAIRSANEVFFPAFDFLYEWDVALYADFEGTSCQGDLRHHAVSFNEHVGTYNGEGVLTSALMDNCMTVEYTDYPAFYEGYESAIYDPVSFMPEYLTASFINTGAMNALRPGGHLKAAFEGQAVYRFDSSAYGERFARMSRGGLAEYELDRRGSWQVLETSEACPSLEAQREIHFGASTATTYGERIVERSIDGRECFVETISESIVYDEHPLPEINAVCDQTCDWSRLNMPESLYGVVIHHQPETPRFHVVSGSLQRAYSRF